MRIEGLIWDEENIEHIAEHQVEMDEVEQVCCGRNQIQRTRSGKHAVLGQTEEGRYLFIALARKDAGRFRVITARDMTQSERRQFSKRK